MFTRCPDCSTVFHITAAELRAADGTVICGACDATFDALDSLSETRPAGVHPEEPEAPPPIEDVPSDPDENARDEEEFLEELESLIGEEGEPDDPLEDQRVAARPAEDSYREEAAADAAADAVPGDAPDDNMDDEFPDPDSVFRVDDLADDSDALSPEPFVGGDAGQGTDEAAGRETPFSAHDDDEAEPTAPAAGRKEAGQAVRVLDAAGKPEPEDADHLPGFIEETVRGRPWLRWLVPLVAVLFLAGTWTHVQRGKLLRLPSGQAVLGPIYSLLGMEVSPDWSPGEFRVLRSEAIANPNQPGNLRVAIEFQNSAAFAQPYPMIRIVLQDRFGQRLGSHDFAPERYLESHTHGARLPAGERLQTSVTVPDPGARADGFRVDLCLELAARGLVCAAEPFR